MPRRSSMLLDLTVSLNPNNLANSYCNSFLISCIACQKYIIKNCFIMCGISGVINFQKHIAFEELSEVSTLTHALKHRGPDSHGFQKFGYKAVLGGTRLRITDSHNPNSDLPFLHRNRYAVVLNGEIYNHKELRQRIPHIRWKTSSDTETLAAAYELWGEKCVEYFEGMFAFGIYDIQEETFFCARDPSGQKPFYYIKDKEAFIFCSELAPLLSNPWRETDFCEDGISEYLAQRMILGADTHIRQIKKLESGCCISITPEGISEPKRYYKIPVGDQTNRNIDELVSDLQERLLTSCNAVLDIEYPAGILLSGGVDSTGVLAAACRKRIKPTAYSIGFAEFEGKNHGIPSIFNEFEYARAAAKHYDIEYREITITPEQYIGAIDRWCRTMDEPLDASEAPMLLLMMEQINADGLRLILSGSGPDEIHDGYGLGQSLENCSLEQVPEAYYDKFSWNFSVDMNKLLPDAAAPTRDRVLSKCRDYLALYDGKVTHTGQAAQLINFHGRLNAYEFAEMDRTSMRHGIEVRSPLIDRRLIEQAFAYDPALKDHQGQSKWLYKQGWRGIVPDHIIDCPKVGFPTPIEFWFTENYSNEVLNTMGNESLVSRMEMVDSTYLGKLLSTQDANHRAFFYRLYTLEKMLSYQSSLILESKNSQTVKMMRQANQKSFLGE